MGIARTADDAVQYRVYERSDGLFQIDEEKLEPGDEDVEAYWLFNSLGLFGSKQDVLSYLNFAVLPPTEIWWE